MKRFIFYETESVEQFWQEGMREIHLKRPCSLVVKIPLKSKEWQIQIYSLSDL